MANIKLTAADDQLAQGTTGDDIVTLDVAFGATAENTHDGNGGSDTFVLSQHNLADFGGSDEISYVGGSVKEWTLDANGTTAGDTTLENGFTKVQFADGNVLEAGVASVHNPVVTDGIYAAGGAGRELTYRWDGSNLTSDDALANADTIVSVGGQVIADAGTIFNTPDGQISIVDSGSATSVQFTASAAALRAAGNVGGTASFSFDIVIRNADGVERTVPVTFQETIPFTDGNDTWVAAATGSIVDETISSSEDDGNDTFTGGAGNDVIIAGDGNDTLTGGEGNDIMAGGADDDRLMGENGNDHLDGGTGENFIRGGNGDDFITAAAGGTGDSNNLGGGAGSDVIVGGEGADTIFGGNGDDNTGMDSDPTGSTNDTWGLNGGAGNDMINGGAGDDLLFGGKGLLATGTYNDTLSGSGNDTLRGGDGDDTMFGGDGNDELRGGAGNDTYDGGAGNDALFVSLGNDTLTGGAGDDTFILRSDSGNTVITDFAVNSDKLDISGLVAQGMTLQSILDNAYEVDPGTGNDFVVLQIDADTTVTLKASSDLSLDDLDAGDFLV